jgi:DNA-binding IclR family transcriptional regulator
MPGLSLTPTQAARLWGIEMANASRILEQLSSDRFLARTASGSYVLYRE